MKSIIILGFIVIVFLASSLFVSQANAQKYPFQSGNRQFQGTRVPVNNTYANSAFGITVKIPEGWSGFEMKRMTGTSVMIAPGGFHMSQGQRPPIIMMLSMYSRNSTTPTPQFVPRNLAQNETCNNESNSTKIVNGMNLTQTMVDCSGQMTIKSEYAVAKTNSSYIVIGYRANSQTNFDSQSAAFDSMLGTLQIANAAEVPEFPIITGIILVIGIIAVISLNRVRIIS